MVSGLESRGCKFERRGVQEESPYRAIISPTSHLSGSSRHAFTDASFTRRAPGFCSSFQLFGNRNTTSTPIPSLAANSSLNSIVSAAKDCAGAAAATPASASPNSTSLRETATPEAVAERQSGAARRGAAAERTPAAGRVSARGPANPSAPMASADKSTNCRKTTIFSPL